MKKVFFILFFCLSIINTYSLDYLDIFLDIEIDGKKEYMSFGEFKSIWIETVYNKNLSLTNDDFNILLENIIVDKILTLAIEVKGFNLTENQMRRIVKNRFNGAYFFTEEEIVSSLKDDYNWISMSIPYYNKILKNEFIYQESNLPELTDAQIRQTYIDLFNSRPQLVTYSQFSLNTLDDATNFLNELNEGSPIVQDSCHSI